MARLLACAWLVLSGYPLLAQDALVWKWKPGDVVNLKYDHATTTAVADSTVQAEWNWHIRCEFVGFRAENALLKTTFDLVDAKNGQLKFAAQLKGAPLTLALAPTGAIQTIEGYEAFLDQASNKDLDRRKTLSELYSRDALKRACAEIFSILPRNAVKPGDMWEATSADPVPPIGGLRTTMRYKYQGDGVISASQAVAFEPNAMPDRLIVVTKLELKAENEKAIYRFDRVAGRLIDGEKSSTFQGTMSATINGIAETLPVRLETKTRIKLIAK